ncbi:MAG: hypothetical protein ACRC35_06450 [Angustibacter sp.]
MGVIDRWRLRRPAGKAPTRPAAVIGPLRGLRRALLTAPGESDDSAEIALRARLTENPNDADAFLALSEIVRRHAAEGHRDAGRRPRAVADAEWALAEELAQRPQAWYPLIELARLSLREDPEGAQRRLSIAAEREPTGRGLAESLAMLRREGMPELALSLGVGYWRPRDHVPMVGRELVQAAAEAGRIAEARRHLDALAERPDADVVDLRDRLDTLARRSPPPPSA